jgi:hypothetical protein
MMKEWIRSKNNFDKPNNNMDVCIIIIVEIANSVSNHTSKCQSTVAQSMKLMAMILTFDVHIYNSHIWMKTNLGLQMHVTLIT